MCFSLKQFFSIIFGGSGAISFFAWKLYTTKKGWYPEWWSFSCSVPGAVNLYNSLYTPSSSMTIPPDFSSTFLVFFPLKLYSSPEMLQWFLLKEKNRGVFDWGGRGNFLPYLPTKKSSVRCVVACLERNMDWPTRCSEASLGRKLDNSTSCMTEINGLSTGKEINMVDTLMETCTEEVPCRSMLQLAFIDLGQMKVER